MTVINLANFIEASGGWRYHNAKTADFTVSNQPGTGLSGTFNYASFIYQGATKNKTGDNFEASFVMSSNPVSIGLITQGVQERWNVDVWTVVLDAPATKSAKF